MNCQCPHCQGEITVTVKKTGRKPGRPAKAPKGQRMWYFIRQLDIKTGWLQCAASYQPAAFELKAKIPAATLSSARESLKAGLYTIVA